MTASEKRAADVEPADLVEAMMRLGGEDTGGAEALRCRKQDQARRNARILGERGRG